ncbi:MAG: GNAT family N-acetyltransferase [Methanomicrobiales archaeon]|nr:GNAT family N-acetyltransferase [Methanomicrobiales archaeon]
MSHSISPDLPYVIKPLASSDVGEGTRCYADIFLNHEPMTRCCRICHDLFFPPAHVYVSLCARDFKSFIARGTISGELAGFVFCSDLSTDWPSRDPRMADLFSLFPNITCILGRLEHYYREQYPSGPGKSLHIFQVGVSPQFQGLGIAKALIRTAVENARTGGFSYVLAECTSPASQGLFSSCGFFAAYEITFRNFSVDGTCYFQDLPGEITLMVREL